MKRIIALSQVLGLFLVFCFVARPAEGTMVLSMNAEQLAEQADRIFHGTVTEVKETFDSEGRWCQMITFLVEEAFKGDIEGQLTIKQVNPNPKKLNDGTIITSTLFQGVPQYEVGEEILIFLRGNSMIGYTSPVGLGQGAFRVEKDTTGQKKLVNGVGNLGLFQRMNHQTAALKAQGIDKTKPQDLSLSQMKTFLKTLVSEQAAAKESSR